MKDIKRLLRKYDYLITIIMMENGCVVKYPPSKFFQKTIVSYWLSNNTIYIKTTFKEELKVVNEELNIPRYAQPFAISTAIIKICSLLKYDHSLINVVNYYRKEEDLDVVNMYGQLFPGMLDEQELEKESYLISIVSHAIHSGFNQETQQMAVEYNVLEGYKVLKSLILY